MKNMQAIFIQKQQNNNPFIINFSLDAQ